MLQPFVAIVIDELDEGTKFPLAPIVNAPLIVKLDDVVVVPFMVIPEKASVPEFVMVDPLANVIVPAEGEKLADPPILRVPLILILMLGEMVADELLSVRLLKVVMALPDIDCEPVPLKLTVAEPEPAVKALLFTQLPARFILLLLPDVESVPVDIVRLPAMVVVAPRVLVELPLIVRLPYVGTPETVWA